MSNETAASGDAGKFLSLHSASFPTVLAVLTGLRAAKAPVVYVVLLGTVGAIAILATEIYAAQIPRKPGQRWKWWVARLSIWLFNSAVVIGSVVFLSTTA